MFYVLSVIICALGVGGVLFIGKDLSVHSTETIAISTAQVPSLALEAHGDRASLWSAFEENFNDPLAHLLLQFMIILLAARTIGSLFRRFGQPSVIGEITAGILLGPSLFGWLWPAVATVGKLGGSMLPARLMGMSWNEAFSLGALMNTRGLVELIALNIGYDLGILSPKVFSMLVLMALTTTFMAGPLLNLAEVHYKHGSPRYSPVA
jgi:Kef-type K+ transport system membrane component KefB